jgi:hypothetical protein
MEPAGTRLPNFNFMYVFQRSVHLRSMLQPLVPFFIIHVCDLKKYNENRADQSSSITDFGINKGNRTCSIVLSTLLMQTCSIAISSNTTNSFITHKERIKNENRIERACRLVCLACWLMTENREQDRAKILNI